MAWTPEQEAAINSGGVSVLVSAAAGSGKTSVLVERLVRKLSDTENKIPADRMIIVTFTKDAAAEMRQRLSSALASQLAENPENQWLSRQQLLLGSAKISTIHSFCFDLIRENIHKLELSGNFRIMDESEASLLIKSTVNEVITDFFENSPEDAEFMFSMFCSRDDKTLETLLESVYSFSSSVPYSDAWLRKCTESYSKSGDAEKKFTAYYGRYVLSLLKKARNLAAKAYELITQFPQKYIDIIESEYLAIEKMCEKFGKPESLSPELAESYSPPEFKRLIYPKDADESVKKTIYNFRDEYKKFMNKKVPDALPIVKYAKDDIKLHYKIMTILEKLVHDLEDRLWKKKIQKNGIGFSDAETLAVKLLSETDEDGNIRKSSLAEELSEYYKLIMIDEFQDTNNNQDLIFKLLSHGGTAECAGDDLFMVGDVKQSIYGFRLANPKNFIKVLDSSVPYSDEARENGRNSYIKLNKNFRSSREVVDFVNYVFRGIMTHESGEIDYKGSEELVLGASFTDRKRNTEIAVINNRDDIKNQCSAVYTARKIKEMLDSKVQVDEKGGKKTRDCTCRDFCILLRGKSKASAYIKELAKFGITAYSEEESGYLKSREISLLVNILRITDNPLLDTAFAAVMLSPMFMITDDEITLMKIQNPTGHIYDAVCRYVLNEKEAPEIDESLRLKLNNIYETLKELRLFSATMPLTGLIRNIYDRTDFISVIKLFNDSEKKRANLRALLEYAKIYQESSDEGLTGFLRYIDRIIKIGKDFKPGNSVSTSEDVVMIKTIHKSKGLEFPFVFLCETVSEFNREDSNKNIRFSFEEGIGFRLQNREKYEKYKTLPFTAIDFQKNAEATNEEMRLLYVALTRAREQLFIPIDLNKSMRKKMSEYADEYYKYDQVTSSMSQNATSMADWLIMTLVAHRDAVKLREICRDEFNIFSFKTSDDIPDVNFTYYETEDLVSDEVSEDSVKEEKKETKAEYLQDIMEQFSFRYDSTLSEMNAKVSVSDIAKDDDRFGIILRRPKFMSEKKMTGSEKGTAVHSILQHADFHNLSTDLNKEVENIVRLGFITERQRQQIDIGNIEKFVSSDIFRRALNSTHMEREKKFLMRISDLDLKGEAFEKYKNTDSMIQGVIDMYFEEPDGIVLVDYKTDNISDMSVLLSHYSLQLSIYRAALEKITSRPVKQTILYSLKLHTSALVK